MQGSKAIACAGWPNGRLVATRNKNYTFSLETLNNRSATSIQFRLATTVAPHLATLLAPDIAPRDPLQVMRRACQS